MRKDVEFKTQDGVTLRGWHYLPDQRSGKVPTIVMAHGFSAVKEMYLDKFAEVSAEAGLGALVFDNRNFGASGGEPRQEIDPWEQVRDYRDAITFVETLPETDADRIGIWGSSYSGGHVLVVGAIERRVCFVATAPRRDFCLEGLDLLPLVTTAPDQFVVAPPLASCARSSASILISWSQVRGS